MNIKVFRETNFKDTELGPLPEEWQVVRLEEVMMSVPKQSRRIYVQDNQMYNLLSVGLYAQGVKVKEQVLGKKLRTKIWYRVERGDFLLLKIWARKGSYGFLKVDVFNSIVSADYPILRVDEKRAILDFTELYLSQSWVWEKLGTVAKGATNRQRVHEKQFLSLIESPLPPLPEQRAIAYVLRTVQEAKQATERVIAALRELKKSLMRHLFTYGPVPISDVGAQHAAPLQDTEIGPIPAHWQVVRLGEVFEIQQGKSLSPKSRTGPRKRPFLRTSNVLWGHIDLSTVDEMHFEETEEKRLLLKPGDLLVCEGGEIGRTAIWEGQLSVCLFQNHLHRLRSKSTEVDSLFYMYWMQAAWLLLGLYGGAENKTTIPNLSRSRLSSLPLPLPPLPEQQEIARILRAVDGRIQAEEAYARALDDLFKSLLRELMSGRLRVVPDSVAQSAVEAKHGLAPALPTTAETRGG